MYCLNFFEKSCYNNKNRSVTWFLFTYLAHTVRSGKYQNKNRVGNNHINIKTLRQILSVSKCHNRGMKKSSRWRQNLRNQYYIASKQTDVIHNTFPLQNIYFLQIKDFVKWLRRKYIQNGRVSSPRSQYTFWPGSISRKTGEFS